MLDRYGSEEVDFPREGVKYGSEGISFSLLETDRQTDRERERERERERVCVCLRVCVKEKGTHTHTYTHTHKQTGAHYECLKLTIQCLFTSCP